MVKSSPEIEQLKIEAYSRMTPAEKLQKMQDMIDFVSQLQLVDIRQNYPDADEHELKMRLASRRMHPDLLRKATGWDVREKGL